MAYNGSNRKSPGSPLGGSRPLRIAVVGAGVVGSVYAARLSDAGHDVTLVARGARLESLRATGLRVQSSAMAHFPSVALADDISSVPDMDLLLVAVRTTQLRTLLPKLAAAPASTVVFLQHLGPYTAEVSTTVGEDRTVRAFPGIGGFMHDDGEVEYVEVAAQPTTIDTASKNATSAQDAIASTGMRTALEADMDAWLATHEIFVSAMGAGILTCAGDAVGLSQNRRVLGQVVQAIHEGFAAREGAGARVTPAALRVLFLRMPLWFAAAYWRRALRGPVGTIALAPHIRASRDDEFSQLCSTVLDYVGSPSRAPKLSALLWPFAGVDYRP